MKPALTTILITALVFIGLALIVASCAPAPVFMPTGESVPPPYGAVLFCDQHPKDEHCQKPAP